MDIDVDFDFRTDSNGKDPDSHSPTLKSYHKYIWTKPLPSGELFLLEDAGPKRYLTFKGSLGIHFLSSDCIAHSYSNRKGRISSVISRLEPSITENFRRINSTIGASIVFPGNRIQGKQTINAARGCIRAIDDRFDLTLECIRRFYLSQPSPLAQVLDRYRSFFRLFVNFEGYVNFFFLNDIVADNYQEICLFLGKGEPFSQPALPQSVEEYIEYRDKSIEFTKNRNARIANYFSPSRFVWTDADGIKLVAKK